MIKLTYIYESTINFKKNIKAHKAEQTENEERNEQILWGMSQNVKYR